MCNDSEKIIQNVNDLWNTQNNIKKDLNKWLDACKKGEDIIRRAKKQFHQWYPIRVYISIGKPKTKSVLVFSLRYFGQEVAELAVKDNKGVKLRLSKNHSERNSKYFNYSSLKHGEYLWNGQEAKTFRKYFKDHSIKVGGMPKLRFEEHRIESKFIEEMLKGKGKFGISDLKIQPITIGGCPLQFPVPFSANTGKPVAKTGHIDILARRKTKDNKTRLSVWELKKPGIYKQAAAQSYIYAMQLLHILRSDKGNEWYKLFGFRGSIPKKLEIEAVVAITEDQKHKFISDKERFQKCEINGDVVQLYAVYYRETKKGIILNEDSFQKD